MTTPQPTTHPGPAPKRLVRTSNDKWISGVCGGLARYAGIDANLVRLLVVVAALVSCGTALLVYLAAWVLMPEE